MTVWKAGMMAVCVAVKGFDDGLYEDGSPVGYSSDHPAPNDLLCVRSIDSFRGEIYLGFDEWPEDTFRAGGFRPAVLGDTQAGRTLIALLDAHPELIPAQHPTGADPARWPLASGETSQCVGPFRRPFHDAAGCATSSHGAPGNPNQSLQQGRKNVSKLSSHRS